MEPTFTSETQPTIKEFKQPGYRLTIALSADKLQCRCSYYPSAGQPGGANMTLEELKEYLAKSLVRVGINEEALANFSAKAAAGEEQIDVLLASGVPPVQGVDGWISYSVKASLESEHGTDDSGSVDFHNVQTFINVAAGDEIGRIVPPDPGVMGKTIVGVPLRPIPGKPLKLKTGKNIRTEENGTLLIAATAGRLCITVGEISVEEEYSVAGDVNFKVGSIVFNGVVNVSGDVLDDFNITASKGIKIGGNIGACAIQCDGDITICGMDGQNKGSINCGGTLRAKFLHDCTITCEGDVFVEVEVHNCIVYSAGKIIVTKGVISGGHCVALAGIEARKIGSPSSVRTKLNVGIDYKDLKMLEQLNVELGKKNKQLEDAISPEKKEEFRSAKMDISKQIKAIRSKVDERANAKINVIGMLYENILISLGNCNEDIKEQTKGPMSIIENTTEGGLRSLTMTGLNVKATDIEQAFVLEQMQQQAS